MKKRVVSLGLATLMLWLMLCTSAFAAELEAIGVNNIGRQQNQINNITGESVLTEQQYAAYMKNLSESELQMIAAKEAAAATAYKSLTRSTSGTKVSIPGTFGMYQQETDTYCIPATVKSILMYINGSSPSQETIAATTGTDPTKIPSYLNDRQDACYYVFAAKSDFDQEGMCRRLYLTIANSEMPASMGISGTTTSNWYYVTSGHSLVVNAIYDDYSYIQFGDPLGGRVAGCPYYYLKSADLCYSVCTRIVW